MAFVIDPSVALAWLLPDETNDRANVVRVSIENGAEAWIPAHWWVEIGNGLLMAERRGRITPDQVAQALSLVDALPFQEDKETAEEMPGRTVTLARKHNLTIYDAVYLELAQRRRAVLSTFDGALLTAASKERIPTE